MCITSAGSGVRKYNYSDKEGRGGFFKTGAYQEQLHTFYKREGIGMAKLNKKLYVRVFAIAVLICLISMIGANVVNTNFGSIEVMDLNIDDSNGNNIACTIYLSLIHI